MICLMEYERQGGDYVLVTKHKRDYFAEPVSIEVAENAGECVAILFSYCPGSPDAARLLNHGHQDRVRDVFESMRGEGRKDLVMIQFSPDVDDLNRMLASREGLDSPWLGQWYRSLLNNANQYIFPQD